MVGLQHKNGESVGIISPDEEKQTPKRLASGKPLFWSIDGKAICYENKSFHRPHVAIIEDASFGGVPHAEFLGRVPLTDAIFVANEKDNSVGIINLGGVLASVGMVEIAAHIHYKDSEGRYLRSIQQANKALLLLTYGDLDLIQEKGEHRQVLRFP